VLVHEAAGWAGYCYRWNATGDEADLLAVRAEADLTIVDAAAPGGQRTQRWTFPSRTDCRRCHQGALGIDTLQLHRDAFGGPQIAALAQQGALQGFDPGAVLTAYPEPTNVALPVEGRARAWLAVNCAHCHAPGGAAAIDLRWATATAAMGVVDVRPQHGSLGLADPWLVRPNDRPSSVLWLRIQRRDDFGMPPLGSHEVDAFGAALVGLWIDSLP
jgi:hypothetical protein